MFQSFDVTSHPDQAAPRVTALRVAMTDAGLDAFIVPRSDAHQGEYVAACDERLAWLTGFTGSAGFSIVTRSAAAMFTDGRYTVQVRAQCDDSVFEYIDWPATSLGAWLLGRDAQTIGFDPWLHTEKDIGILRKTLEGSGKTISASQNLIDKIWTDRPDRPNAPVFAQPFELTGQTSEEKFEIVCGALRKHGADTVVFTLPDSLSWLLNIRGADIAHNPVVQAFATLSTDGKMHLFAEPSKFDALDPDPRISIAPRSEFNAHLQSLEGTVLIDPATAPYALRSLIEGAGAQVVTGEDPCILPKACKTDAEIAGAREAHLRDGAAMVEFLAWLDAQVPDSLTEISVARALEGFRAATNQLKDISFDTISGSGPNGAIVHYRVTTETDRPLSEGELLLLDSGGQYIDGTTDITRTVSLGHPRAEERESFTAVLQGMIAISTARFPRGVAGAHLDSLARAPLWRMGRDYDHGTGHGVGAFLSVHEGPQRISRASDLPLREGMILSNEPGYYKAGSYGIRIENLIVVRSAPDLSGGDPRDMLDFETLTFVPIDRDLINADEMAPWERDWLDGYHAQVWNVISPRVSDSAKEWLRHATTAV
ncbi:aminopeptidase P family protein [Pacificibacter marinus]|uniref:Xaa-Pro dipeptidase n=1 Tax=Pacificibacter marinus TaxID=658057 RepID=A0A1Y5SJX5_9RHOB|nr:aminopeptidase P family protein [Pacificibacter marinus]SEK62874.1 Xaa-Pro aminopeptidase [Pacificibacter marinus]SLN40808.1 Xaa-Pro dipeptidase [Pacificibacter marinus]